MFSLCSTSSVQPIKQSERSTLIHGVDLDGISSTIVWRPNEKCCSRRPDKRADYKVGDNACQSQDSVYLGGLQTDCGRGARAHRCCKVLCALVQGKNIVFVLMDRALLEDCKLHASLCLLIRSNRRTSREWKLSELAISPFSIRLSSRWFPLRRWKYHQWMTLAENVFCIPDLLWTISFTNHRARWSTGLQSYSTAVLPLSTRVFRCSFRGRSSHRNKCESASRFRNPVPSFWSHL